MSRNFRMIWMNLREEDNYTPKYTYDQEKSYNYGIVGHEGGFGNVRYIPKDAKIDGI